VAATVATLPIAAPQQTAQHSGFQSSDADDRRLSEPTAAVVDTTDSVPDATFAAIGAPGVSAAAAVLPTASPQASAVVSQIASQADQYRLPSNKGLRIQLHPEDLGGVQVTLRYSPVGGVELHIAVEHAATGTLVQAGWTELRDALANQGISPERLIMSVTSAANTGQSDMSGGGNRSDPGLASQSNQMNQGSQGQAGQERSGPRGWTGAPISGASAIDDSQPVTSVTTVPSRIDFRA
jgi:flagellar hook-length control protein FliK